MNTEIVSSLEIAASRADEIGFFSNNLTNKENSKAQATFPKHLRRRAASHNPKRVPQRLREKYLVKTKAAENITKRPSRRFRRRPKNLLEEYNRRQRRHAWLETHIWHAKRFQMVEKWGYRLPNKPQEKSFRACYRASRRQCLMQDISFLQCIQIQGPEELIIERLNRLTHPSTGLSFSSKASLSGAREGNAVVYSQGCYPNGVIGQVCFMWRPVKRSADRTIWIWVHPSIYQHFFQELLNTFEVRKVERGQMEAKERVAKDMKEGEEVMETVYSDSENIGINETGSERDQEEMNETENKVHKKEKKKRRNVDLEKLASRNVPYERTPMWESDLIKIVELRGTLNRFSLRGPVTQKILSEVLKVAVIDKDSEFIISKEVDPPSFSKWADFEKDFSREGTPTLETEYILDDLESRQWWKKEFTDPANRKVFFQQKKFWESIEDVLPGQCSPRMILGLTVLDPRPFLPPKRQLHRPSAAKYKERSRKDDLPCSFLWDEKVRDCVSLSKISDNILNRQRGSLKLGENLVLGEAGSKIPLILLQQPGVQGRNGKDTSMGTGWDLILPANWGMAFWLALVYNGARAGGLREERMLRFECSIPEGNLPTVDSVAGKLELGTEKEFLLNEFFKHPPNNRSNLIKLGVHWAFEPPLEQLVSEWNNSNSGYYVLRDRSALMKIEKVLSKVVLTAKKEHNSKLRIAGAKFPPNFSQDSLNLNLEIDSEMQKPLASKSSIASEKNEIIKSVMACDILKDSHSDATLPLAPEDLSSLLLSLSSALIPVKVSMLSRGSPEGYTSLCLPSPEDIAKLEEGNFFGPIEPLKEDRDEKRRHELKKEHQKELRGLKRKRKHLKNEMFLEKVKKLNGLFSNEQMQSEDRGRESMIIELNKYKSQEKSDQYNAEIREIWLPKCRSIRHCNSREIIGFGLTGGFSYSESKGEALGYIVAGSVERLLACQGCVLVREAHSQQYRFAALSVLL